MTARDQVADLILKDPQTGDDMAIVSDLRNEPDGLMSFDAQSSPDSPKWKIEIRVSEK